MKLIVKVTFLLTVLGAGGCAGYAPSISQSYKPTTGDAFFYGRFVMDAEDVALGLAGYLSMGFNISCENGEQYIFGFKKEDVVQVVKFTPSTCSLKELVYSNADGFIKSRKPAPAGVMENETFSANKAYYLGDFRAQATRTVIGNTISMNWRLTGMKDDYQKTTEELKTKYPNLNTVETENKILIKK